MLFQKVHKTNNNSATDNKIILETRSTTFLFSTYDNLVTFFTNKFTENIVL